METLANVNVTVIYFVKYNWCIARKEWIISSFTIAQYYLSLIKQANTAITEFFVLKTSLGHNTKIIFIFFIVLNFHILTNTNLIWEIDH